MFSSDEIMYQAKLHPEQYSNTFSEAQVKQLHDAMMYVCNTAVDTLAESDKFPEDWLMKHRWGKGKKDGGKLPNGAKITFLKVGGRTSAVVPSVQKKTGAVAGDISNNGEDDDEDIEEERKPGRTAKRKNKGKKDQESDESEEKLPVSTKRGRGRKAAEPPVKEKGGEDDEAKVPMRAKQGGRKVADVKQEAEEEEEEEDAPKAKKQKVSTSGPTRKKTANQNAQEKDTESTNEQNGRRRSGRASRA